MADASGNLVEVVDSVFWFLFGGVGALFHSQLLSTHLFVDSGGKVADVTVLACGDTEFLCVGTSQTFHGLVEVDQMTVELGAVDARELHLAANCDAASTAHAGTVDHHGVERDNGRQVVLLGEQRYKLHHRQGTDGDTAVVLFAALNQLFNLVGHQSFLAIAAVIGDNVEVIASGTHTILEENQTFVASTDNHIASYPVFVRPFDLRIDRSGTHAASDEEQA